LHLITLRTSYHIYKGIQNENSNIITQQKALFHQRLVEACEQRGHEPMVLDVLRSYMDIASSKPEVP